MLLGATVKKELLICLEARVIGHEYLRPRAILLALHRKRLSKLALSLPSSNVAGLRIVVLESRRIDC